MTVCHLWRLSAQPTSPLNSVLVCFLLLFDLGRGFFEGGGGGGCFFGSAVCFVRIF